MHEMVTVEEVMADRNDIVKCAGCCEKHDHECQRENDRPVMLVYPVIDGVHVFPPPASVDVAITQLTYKPYVYTIKPVSFMTLFMMGGMFGVIASKPGN